MIEIKNISKTYNGKVKAVNHLNLTVEDGEIIGFIGPNGAGKTTTLKMMTGILNPDEGEILLNGINIQHDPLEAKRQFGFVPDNPDIFLRLKGIEYLNFMADIYDVKEDVRRERIAHTAETFQMTSALNDTILSYSHGMRQKIVMMGVLVHSPNIWILDEPLTGLDPQSAYALKEMMREHVAQNKTVFFSTHVLEVAEKLCSKVAIINKGELFYFGPLETLKQQYPGLSLEDIFLKVTSHE
jgi:ABC-2 type transport system ATP-binding protein